MPEVDEKEEVEVKSEKETPETVELFNVHQGLRGRDGGPYQDVVERERAEVIRAQREGRDPNFDPDVMPATVGTPLVPASALRDNTNSHPSMDHFSTAGTLGPDTDSPFVEAPEVLPINTKVIETEDTAPEENVKSDSEVTDDTTKSLEEVPEDTVDETDPKNTKSEAEMTDPASGGMQTVPPANPAEAPTGDGTVQSQTGELGSTGNGDTAPVGAVTAPLAEAPNAEHTIPAIPSLEDIIKKPPKP